MSATNRGADRRVNDSYQTPLYTVKSLLNTLDLKKVNNFLEPCKGDGNILNSVDVTNKYWAEIEEGVDYLKEDYNVIFDLIVTNPPFSLAKEFLEKSLKESKSVWYLLRINFLESRTRAEWWQYNLPTHLLALSARPSFTGKGTDATAYAWFGWDYAEISKLNPGIHVLPYLKE